MATSLLPPFPVNSPPGSFVWVDWFKKLEDFIISVTDITDSGTSDDIPVTIDTGSGPVSDIATGYYTRIANYVLFTLEVTLPDVVSPDPYIITLDLPPAVYPYVRYNDTFTYTNQLDDPPSTEIPVTGVGKIYQGAILGALVTRLSFGPIDPADIPLNKTFVLSGRYFY